VFDGTLSCDGSFRRLRRSCSPKSIGKSLGAINTANLRAAHEELETGKVIGKIVLEWFETD